MRSGRKERVHIRPAAVSGPDHSDRDYFPGMTGKIAGGRGHRRLIPAGAADERTGDQCPRCGCRSLLNKGAASSSALEVNIKNKKQGDVSFSVKTTGQRIILRRT